MLGFAPSFATRKNTPPTPHADFGPRFGLGLNCLGFPFHVLDRSRKFGVSFILLARYDETRPY